MMILFAIITILSLALLDNTVTATDLNNRETLKDLCQEKPAKLTRLSDLKLLIDLLKTESERIECSDDIRQAILDFEPLIDSQNVCSIEHTDKLNYYHSTHVLKKSKKHMPLFLRDFFVAYGLEISKLCKLSLMDRLANLEGQVVSSEDMTRLIGFTNNDGTLETYLAKQSNLEDLFLFDELMRVSNEKREKKNKPKKYGEIETLAVNNWGKFMIESIQRKCKNIFKPIYQQLIVPIVQLSFLGLDYNEPEFKIKMEEFKQKNVYKHWYKIVFTCQSIDQIRPVVLSNRLLEENNVNKKTVVVLDDDDISHLMRKPSDPYWDSDSDSDSDSDPDSDFDWRRNSESDSDWDSEWDSDIGDEKDEQLAIAHPELLEPKEPINYEAIVSLNPETNLVNHDDDDLYLKKALSHYKTKRSYSNYLFKRLSENLPKILKSYMQSDRIRFGLKNVNDEKRRAMNQALYRIGGTKTDKSVTKPYRLIRKCFKWAMALGLVGLGGVFLAMAIYVHEIFFLVFSIYLIGWIVKLIVEVEKEEKRLADL